ncbi:MAG TPA: histidine phosphatase family protein [Acidobacteriaceae bacterium]|jgi:probable phosphoglycerate mutase
MNGEAIELWVIRHGETEWSADGRHTGRTDIPLTEQGRQRALKLRQYLEGTTFAAVRRSPMLRAKETCELAGFGAQAVVDDNLCEWDYGVFEGRTSADIQAEIPDWSVWTSPIVNGETVEHVGERADAAIANALAAAAPAQPAQGERCIRVALFAHAHILRILAARWIGLDARGGRLFTLGTGSVSVLGWERNTRVVQRWNRGFDG